MSICNRYFVSMLGLLVGALLSTAAQPKEYRIVHSFSEYDGRQPQFEDLLPDYDQSGRLSALYGTTAYGGDAGAGVVFKVTPDGNLTVLHSFGGDGDGVVPYGDLTIDAQGKLYGTTWAGGSNDYGIVYELKPDGSELVLHNFTGGSDGGEPYSGVIRDAKGNLYGTTYNGGGNNQGTVFKITPHGSESVLYSFLGEEGVLPAAGLVMDNSGTLYGTTVYGAMGYGSVFSVAQNGTFTVLHAFTGAEDGGNPVSALIIGKGGNLYGTAAHGGVNDNGVVFEITSGGAFSVLHTFAGLDGARPLSRLLEGPHGALLGTTEFGGKHNLGTIFRLTSDGRNRAFHTFKSFADGINPIGGLTKDHDGNLFGTTLLGGIADNTRCSGGCGVVFELSN